MWSLQKVWFGLVLLCGLEAQAAWLRVQPNKKEKILHRLHDEDSWWKRKKWIRSTAVSFKKIEDSQKERVFQEEIKKGFQRRRKEGRSWIGPFSARREERQPEAEGTRKRLCRRPVKKLQRLVDIRYAKTAQTTRVVLLMSGTVQIEQGEAPAVLHRGLPARFYVDLRPSYAQRAWTRETWTLEDQRVTQLRVGRHTKETVRVVFALGQVTRYQVSVLPSPLRIVVDFSQGSLPPRPTSKMALPPERPKIAEKPLEAAPTGGQGTTVDPSKKKAEEYVLRYRGSLQLPFPYSVQKIALDAGHGGLEEGAVGRKTRLQEKMVTLDITKRVFARLREITDVGVFLTREVDKTISLEQRAKKVKEEQADLLISIHINSSPDRRLQGLATYFLDWDERLSAAQMLASNPLFARENQGVDPARFKDVGMILSGLQIQTNSVISRVLGVAIQRRMLQSVRQKVPQARDLGVRKGLFYLLFASEVPSVLVEASFLSHPHEERLLGTASYRQGIAEGIAQGIADFVVMSRHSQATTRPKKQPSKRPTETGQTTTKSHLP